MRGHTRYPDGDPRHYTQKACATLDQLIQLLREDIHKVHDSPKAQALFETSAEVLTGLKTAFERYERAEEQALREPAPQARSSARPS